MGVTNTRQIDEMATSQPKRLAQLVREGGIPDPLLTFAAEELGSIPDVEQALGALKCVLEHPKSYVREGAIYGLARLSATSRWAQAVLASVAKRDPDPELRLIAAELIDD